MRIVHFGGESEPGVVSEVHDGGRRLGVAAASGEEIEFALSPATAKFVAAGAGASLELLQEPQGA